jgi:acetyl esterase/lipase
MMTTTKLRKSAAMTLALVLGLGCAAATAIDWPRLAYRVQRDIVYGQGYVQKPGAVGQYELRDLTFDLISPRGAGAQPRAAMVLIHGGGFDAGDKDEPYIHQLACDLARRGVVCFVMNYRLSGEFPPAPEPYAPDPLKMAGHAAMVDAKVMLRYVHAHAKQLDVDRNRIVIGGDSAGAITALGAGLSDPDQFACDRPDLPVPETNHPGKTPQPKAIVNLWGMADMFLELFSRGDPPIMTVHGGKDFTVGLSLMPAETIKAACEKNGIPNVYYPVKEAGHGVWDIKVDGKDLAGLIDAFLDKYARKKP